MERSNKDGPTQGMGQRTKSSNNKISPGKSVSGTEKRTVSSQQRRQPENAHEDASKDKSASKTTMRALMAVSPYRELTLEESQRTLVVSVLAILKRKRTHRYANVITDRKTRYKKSFEDAVGDWLYRYRHYLFILMNVLFITAITAPFVMLLPFPPNIMLFLLSICALAGIGFITLFLSHCNPIILKMLVGCFDSIFFSVEALAFCVSLWGVYCFSLYGFFLSIIAFSSSFWIIFHDAFHVNAKKAMKYPLLYGLFGFCFLLFGVAFDLFPGGCQYRIDVKTGKLLTPDQVLATSISLDSVCINAGITYAILALRTGYTLIAHPEDCVILTSAIEVCETRTEEEHKALSEEADRMQRTFSDIAERRALYVATRYGGSVSIAPINETEPQENKHDIPRMKEVQASPPVSRAWQASSERHQSGKDIRISPSLGSVVSSPLHYLPTRSKANDSRVAPVIAPHTVKRLPETAAEQTIPIYFPGADISIEGGERSVSSSRTTSTATSTTFTQVAAFAAEETNSKKMRQKVASNPTSLAPAPPVHHTHLTPTSTQPMLQSLTPLTLTLARKESVLRSSPLVLAKEHEQLVQKTDTLTGEQSMTGARHSRFPSVATSTAAPHLRQEWNTVIVAVKPLTILTTEESSLTVTEKIYGKKVLNFYFRAFFILNPLAALAITYHFVFISLAHLTDVVEIHPILSVLHFALTAHIYNVTFPVTNYKLASSVLRSFSLLFMCGEAVLFTLSLWIYQCATPTALYFTLCYFSGFFFYVIFDALSVTRRRRMRLAYVGGLIMMIVLLVLTQLGELKRHCHVRFTIFPLNLELGDAKNKPPDSTMLVSMSWKDPSQPFNVNTGFSVQEFHISRGITVMVLMARVFYNIMRRPGECVMVQSSVRIMNVAPRPKRIPS